MSPRLLTADTCTICEHNDLPSTSDPSYTCLGTPFCNTTMDSMFCGRCNTVTIFTCVKEGFPPKIKRDYDCFTGSVCGGVQANFNCDW